MIDNKLKTCDHCGKQKPSNDFVKRGLCLNCFRDRNPIKRRIPKLDITGKITEGGMLIKGSSVRYKCWDSIIKDFMGRRVRIVIQEVGDSTDGVHICPANKNRTIIRLVEGMFWVVVGGKGEILVYNCPFCGMKLGG